MGMTFEQKNALAKLLNDAHQTAIDKGWWDMPRTFGDQIALMHSELSEALEDFRAGEPMDVLRFEPTQPETPGKPVGIASEFADVLIRIFDTCEQYKIPLVTALEAKLEYNKSRPHRHGGKKL